MPDTPDTPHAPDLILGVSGLRGIVGQSLTPEVAMRYAAAFGAWLEDQIADREPLVLVARDGRAGGEAVYTAAISGLLATGCRVRRLGVAMTPSAGVVTDSRRGDACLIATASHNPQEWNGLKILIRPSGWADDASDARGGVEGPSDACAPDADTAQAIVDAFQAGRCSWAPQEHVNDSTVDDDIEHAHCLRVLSAADRHFRTENYWDMFDAKPLFVIADAVNASGARIDDCFFDGAPGRFIQLHGDSSGLFPHPPEPTRENLSGKGGLCDAVPALNADIGFAQDPDGDRLAIIDERGRYIGEEYTLALAAESLLSADNAPKGAALVTNLSTSRLLDDVAAAHRATVHRTPVGEANVVARMKALKAAGHTVLLGGEGNGGVIWPQVTYVRDSLSAMALTLALMARTGKTISQLVADLDARSPAGGYAIVKRKQPLASKSHAAPALAKLAKAYSAHRLDTQDGVRIDLTSGPHKGAWVHVRPSNTEPILRLIAEAGTEKAAHALLDEIAAAIA